MITLCRKPWRMSNVLLLMSVWAETDNVAANPCAKVSDVRVLPGGSAELSCSINHTRNDPRQTTQYSKIWLKKVGLGRYVNVYSRIIKDGNITLMDSVGSTPYEGRVVRSGDDVVTLSDVTAADSGTYKCSWQIRPEISGCEGNQERDYSVVVILSASSVHISVTSPKQERKSTVFTCTASGTSPITYTLHKVGGATPSDRWSNASGVFTLSNIQRADAGEYRCTADNEAKRPQTSDAVTLDVYFPLGGNSFQESPPGSVAVGNQKSLTCTTDSAKPTAEITWTTEGQPVTGHVVTTNPDGEYGGKKTSSTLTITTTKQHNANVYACIVKYRNNEINRLKRTTVLDVTFKTAGVKTIPSPSVVVTVNTDVTLTCKTSSSSNPPVSLGWTRDGSTVTDGVTPGTEDGDHNAKVSTSQLRFTAEKQNNGNVYVCRVTTMTHLTDQTTLNVTFPPDHVTLSESPPCPVRFGTTKSLTCSTDSASPAAHITWTRNGVTVSGDLIAEINDGLYKAYKILSTITIHTTRDHNEDVYKCHVKHMEQDVPGLAQSLPLNVTFPNNVYLSVPESSIMEGSDTTLTCQASGGNPQTVLSYEWRGPSLIATTPPVIGSTNQLTLINVSYMNAGKYSCAVTNMGGRGFGYGVLNVHYLARLNPLLAHKHLLTAELNQTETFTLNVIANPAPTYDWSRIYDDKETPLLAKSIVKNGELTSNLTIPMTTNYDKASYICRVRNLVGMKLFMVKLILAAPPDQPSTLIIVNASAVSVTLRWTAGFNGGFQQSFSVMNRQVGQTWPHESQTTGIPDPGEYKRVLYKVENLVHNTTYEFRVRSENQRQNKERMSLYSITIQAKTKAKPTIAENKLKVMRLPMSASATASWPEPHGFYTDIRLSVCEEETETCRLHAVNTSESRTRTHIRHLDADKTYIFTLQLYDNADLVYASEEFVSTFQDAASEGDNKDEVIGALAGLFAVALVTIVVLAISLVVMWRRNPHETGSRAESTNAYEDTVFADDLSGNTTQKAGIVYENLQMINSKSQRTIDQIEAHNKSQSRVVTRGLSDDRDPGQFVSQAHLVCTDVFREHQDPDGNQYEHLKRNPDTGASTESTYSQLQKTTQQRLQQK